MNQGDWYGSSLLHVNSGESLVSKVALLTDPAVLYDLRGMNGSGSTVYIFVFDLAAAISDGALSAGNAAALVDCFAVAANTHFGIPLRHGAGTPLQTGLVVHCSSSNFPTITSAVSMWVDARYGHRF